MTRSGRLHIPRLWRHRQSSRRAAAGLVTTGEAAAHRCSVFLAPPGAGKSTSLRTLAGSSGEHARLISLGSEYRRDEKIQDAVAGGTSLLILDGLDESRLTTTALAGLVREVIADLRGETRLALACRTAAWQPGVEQAVLRGFEDVAIFELEELNEADIAAYADSAGLDGEAFLRAVREAHALPLATNAFLLELLVDEHRAGATLPAGQRELYQQSCERLAAEPNPDRQDPLRPEDVPRLLDSAGRMAVFSLFTGRGRFSPAHEPDPDVLTRAACAPPDGDDRYNEVLATALFAGAGDRRLGFAHQTLAEFLAARHLAGTGLPTETVGRLLHGRGGQLAPQVQAVAAWLIALEPGRFADLLDENPVAFLESSVELTDPFYRQSLVGRLLELAEGHDLPDFALQVHGLGYPGIEDDLRPRLTDRRAGREARCLAVRIAGQNELSALAGDLTEVALDEETPTAVRVAAGQAVLDLGAPDAGRLAALSEPGAVRNDEGDELLGLGIRALIETGAPLAVILPRLKPPSEAGQTGDYRTAVADQLPRLVASPELTVQELCSALAWAAARESRLTPMSRASAVDKLGDTVLRAGIRASGDDSVRAGVLHMIEDRLTSRAGLFLDPRAQLPHTSEEVRRSLLGELVPRLTSRDDIEPLRRAGLLQSVDLSWARSEAERATTDEAGRRWAEWIVPIALSAERTAAAARRASTQWTQWASAQRWGGQAAQTEGRTPQPPPEALPATLEQGLAQRPVEAFADVCHYLVLSGREAAGLDTWSTLDVTGLTGWTALSDPQRRLVTSAATGYLLAATDLGDPAFGADRGGLRALTGVRAFALLTRTRQKITLDRDRWVFWAPALVRFPLGGAGEEGLAGPLRQLAGVAWDTFRDSAEHEIRQAGELGRFILQRFATAAGPRADSWLITLVEDITIPDSTAAAALERLLVLSPETGRRLLRTRWIKRDQPMRSRLLLVSACQAGGPRAWPEIRDLLASDHALATEVITDLAESASFSTTTWSEHQVGELWELARSLFPRAGDQVVHGNHAVGRREIAGNFRDRLLPAVARRGTQEAVALLRSLSEAHPEDPSIKQVVAQARAALGRADWTPLSPAELGAALSSGKRIIRSDADLVEVVVAALEKLRRKLRGATPMATFLWNHIGRCTGDCRPKSEEEISDFVSSHLADTISGVVVNREVQVIRARTSGLGQRTDLLVQANAPEAADRVLRVAIEVKGCWNPEIADALEAQLVDRYVTRWPAAGGVFLVAWFDPAHGFQPGRWRRDPVLGDRPALARDLAVRAIVAGSSSGRAIESVVLDCSMPAR